MLEKNSGSPSKTSTQYMHVMNISTLMAMANSPHVILADVGAMIVLTPGGSLTSRGKAANKVMMLEMR